MQHNAAKKRTILHDASRCAGAAASLGWTVTNGKAMNWFRQAARSSGESSCVAE